MTERTQPVENDSMIRVSPECRRKLERLRRSILRFRDERPEMYPSLADLHLSLSTTIELLLDTIPPEYFSDAQ